VKKVPRRRNDMVGGHLRNILSAGLANRKPIDTKIAMPIREIRAKDSATCLLSLILTALVK